GLQLAASLPNLAGACELTVFASQAQMATTCHRVVDGCIELGAGPGTASGVRGITLADDKDEVIGMVSVNKEDINETQLLVVTENGYGKRTKLVDDDGEDVYRITNRGGKGVKTLNITEKTGALISINAVTDMDDLMIINKSGLTIRMEVSDLRVMGRATQGVRLINIKGNDSIAAVTKVMKEEESDEDTDADINGVNEGDTSTETSASEE
uniref:DNA gyrase C-terminal beta-propeller domain-containing protein n=1 Tax=Flavobacterium sp. TaxID=239 RepID=UPI0025F68C5A